MNKWLQHMLGRTLPGEKSRSGNPGNVRLSAAIAHEKAGDSDAAEALYRQVISDHGDSVTALRLLGKLLAKNGSLQEAEELLDRALTLSPRDADICCDLANVHHLHGNLSLAREYCLRGLEIDPAHPLLHYNLGMALLGSGNKEEALWEFEKAVEAEPSFYLAKRQYALLLFEQGDPGRAVPMMQSLLMEHEEDAALHHCLGVHAYDEHRYPDALRYLQASIHLDQGFKDSYLYLGMCLEKTGEYSRAVEALDMALELDPHYVKGMLVLGDIYLAMDDKQHAAEYFQEALALDQENASLYGRIGDMHLDRKFYSDAISYYMSALRIRPGYLAVLHNLGACYQKVGNCSEAAKYYRQVLALEPDNAEAHLNHSLTLLLNGNIEEGWREYEWGLQTRERKIRKSDIDYWQGEDIADRTILVRAEQGLGDEIMFASCLPDLISRARQVHVECDKRLESLYKRSFPTATITGIARKQPPLWQRDKHVIDYQVPVGSLPLYFRRTREEFPLHNGYLKADPGKVAYWKTRLASLGVGKKIGISWRSRLSSGSRDVHYTRLSDWAPILKTPGVHFVNLQYDECADELAEMYQTCGVKITDFADLDQFDDIDGVAALMGALDLIIAGSTSVAELAGALGRPVWKLQRTNSWAMLGTDASPWYPATRIFLQEKTGDWSVPIRRIESSLEAYACERNTD